MLLIILLVAIIEPVLIVGCVYLILYKLKTLPKKTIKIKAPVKPITVVSSIIDNKKIVTLPYDSIYTTNTMRETPVKYAGGDLVPYGLSDSDKALLEAFYSKD